MTRKDIPVNHHYAPDTRFNAGFVEAIGALSNELWSFRSHISTLFANDFRAGYRGTVLGVFWNIILPIIPVTVYILLVNLRVFPAYEGLDPALYIGFNATVWYVLTGAVTRPISIVKSKNAEAMKTAMPLSAAIASSFAGLCFDTVVRAAFVAAMAMVYLQTPSIFAPLALLLLLPGILFSLSLGLMLSIFNMIYRDVERVVSIVFQYGIFLSGVIFPVASLGPLAPLEIYNPLNVFIQSVREAFFFGSIPHPEALLAWSLAGLALVLVAFRFFYVMEHRIRSLTT